MDNDPLRSRIGALAGPVADAAGIELVDVEVRGQRGSRVVRLVADADGGLGVAAIAALSRDVGRLLDDDDVVEGRYTLEVTTPGVDRPLRSATQLRRNVGRDVRVVRTRAAIDRGEKGEVVGTLAAVTDESVRLAVGDGDVVVPTEELDYAKVVLPW